MIDGQQLQETVINNQESFNQKMIDGQQLQESIINNQEFIRVDLVGFADSTVESQQNIIDNLDQFSQEQTTKQVTAIKEINDTLTNEHQNFIMQINEPIVSSVEQHAENGTGFLDSIISETLENEKFLFDESLLSQVNSTAAGAANSSISQESSSPWFDKFNTIFPDPQQCDIKIPNVLTGGTIPLNNEWSVILKTILAWVISFYTFLVMFEILFTPVTPKA